MKKGDIIWILALLSIGAILIVPTTHEVFISLTQSHPYLMGFVKVAILAMMGELMALRIMTGHWSKPVGTPWRAFIWGLFGMAFAVVFPLFDAGVRAVIAAGLLPTIGDGSISTPLFISAFMNLAFAPTFMGAHRITDTYIELCDGKVSNLKNVSIGDVTKHIDWKGLISFVYLKTIPIFWIPAHTVTFLLPPEYRVLMASFLSTALGGILAFAKKNK